LISKLLVSIVAVASALVVPLAARSQVAPDRPPKDVTNLPEYKNEIYVGWSYTSLNQVSQSRSGLQGFSASLGRNIGNHFGVKVDGGHYAWALTSGNPGSPTVDMFLAGPVLRANLYEKWSLYVEGLLGGVHTGGVSIEPNVSFAGGPGIGLDYNRNPRWTVRLYGNDIGSSFTLTPFQPGFSPHLRWNARAGIGVAYHF
jgi:hypothetical protein